jgi:hypothetical protein
MTAVLITVDTELAWRHHAAGHGWEEVYRRSCEPAGVGLGYQLALLERHGLKACFFVDPMPALVHGIAPVRRMVETILEGGQEVQLHLHALWSDTRRFFELNDLCGDGQREMIATAIRLLMEAGAPAPIAFRAGSYAANDRTLALLADSGIAFDSSFNGSHAPSPCAVSLPAGQIDPAGHHGIIEIPVTQFEERSGRLRHLQLCATSHSEMKGALAHAAAQGQQLVTIVSHSFELATRDGLRQNRIVRRRFDALCAHLDVHRAALPTAHFADLGTLRLDGQTAPMAARPWRTALRNMSQFAANLMFERRL